ncbi:AAA family ATPase [Microbacterium arabinogalactanolyticum]|uniref:AAA family ATPase n=1 Tax=Microbacterium arabinogalactanolyticum TaxID=69365 RepID=UPI0025561CC1|nr:SMC family ATPase [Microbacterium arabinogalactanolyticum]GLC85474.1 nuclease SbcCD subunit C [Microbacterium arabinogalactanolyticum]
MQLHRLEVEGFGPFRARQVVEFDAFADDGIFLIAGRTGAGKSSILDAVCFGLYGGVPRYDGGEKRLRSDHSEPDDPTEVVVEFSTVAGRFRVTRSPAYERPAKRGGGMTTQQPSALLEQLVGGEWIGRAARVVDVAHELDEILQLSQEQFLQVILLAQNRFADFLLADSKERQALLRRLFGTERFSDYQARFDELRRAAEQGLAGRRATVDARLDEAERLVSEAELWGDDADAAPDGTDARIELLRRAIARADYQVERFGTERVAAEKALTAADAALADLKEQRQGQVDRDRARSALAALESQAEEIADAAQRRDRGRAAEALRALITAAARGREAVELAARAETDAVDAATAAGVPIDPRADDPALAERPQGEEGRASAHYRSWASDRTRESGGWQHAAELEASAPARARELAAARETESALSAGLTSIDAERENLPDRIAKVTAERDAARTQGALVESAAQTVATAEARAMGVLELERLTAAVAEAARAESEASDAHTRAQEELSALRRRRLDGYAGELAEALVPGEPCAVCGSVEHPAPAQHADPVTAEDVAAAESLRDAAAGAEREASRALSEVTAARAAAAERAGGRTAEQAAAELEHARAAHQAAVAAAELAETLTAQLHALQQDAADVEERRAAASEHLNAARTSISLVEQRIEDADRTVAEARGEYPTVAERIGEARRQIAAATAAADAIDAHVDAAERADLARHERDQALEASMFTDATEAEQALLSAAEIAAIDDRVTEHAVAVKKERALLLDLEMRMLPDELIDLEPAQDAAAAARTSWTNAVDADSRARGVQAGLTATVDAAASEHAASAADARDFEILRSLADTLAGRSGNTRRMNLETFVLAAELEEIVAAANLRLRDMSDGRYELRHSDAVAARGAASGLGIVVFDAFTGQTRPAKSLSGGETFLSSLALALGLAEVVTARAGGIRLDTLFIDEGFGSLDSDTLETAMRTLDELRQGGRTVGVISHVEAMQEQIPAQLTVRALPDGPSVIDAPRA